MLWGLLTAAVDTQLEIARLTTRATVLAALITGLAAVAAAWFSRSAANASRAMQSTLDEHGRLLVALVDGREEETRVRTELERRVDGVEQTHVLCSACPILRPG